MEFIVYNKLQTKTMALFYMLAIFFVVIDRFLKFISLKQYSFFIYSDILQFNFVKNYFIAFSIPLSGILLNYLILAIIIVLLYLFLKSDNFIKGIFLFIVLGASSNLYDRFIYGYVIDYINLKWFTVFNVADIMIVSAILMLILVEFRSKPQD